MTKKFFFLIFLLLSGFVSGIATSPSSSRLSQDLVSLLLLKSNVPCSSQGARPSLTGAYIESLTCIIPVIGNVKAENISIRPTLGTAVNVSGDFGQGTFSTVVPFVIDKPTLVALDKVDLSQFDILKNNFALEKGLLSTSLLGDFSFTDVQFEGINKKLPLPESLASLTILSLSGKVSSPQLPSHIDGTFVLPEGNGKFQTEFDQLTCKGIVRFTLNDKGVEKFSTLLKLLNQKAIIKKDSPLSLTFSGKYDSPQFSLTTD